MKTYDTPEGYNEHGSWKVVAFLEQTDEYGVTTRLVTLNCLQNKLTKIDVSDCAELEKFYCGLNNLTELKMNEHAKLRLYDTIVKDGVITATER